MADNPPQPGTTVELRGLSLQAGPRRLLDEANARFEPGRITLIVGPSGAGKSLLLRVLAGLIGEATPEISVRGQVFWNEREVLESGRGPGPAGVVFQNFALFDELSPRQNVQFAAAHRRVVPGEDRPDPVALLDELGVPQDVRTASLSGGQRQRLAIARTLAYDPQVMLYDEPTSGLDPGTAAQVARLIQTTHLAHGKTSIVVTHDDRALAPIADRIYLFDAQAKTLREIDRSEWSRLGEAFRPLDPAADPSAGTLTARPPRGLVGRALAGMGDFFVHASRVVDEVAQFPIRLLPRWRSVGWGLRYTLHYLRLVADPSAWLYIAIAGAIAGYVSTYFTFRFLPFRSYTEPLVIENLLAALGFATYRIFVPVLTTILIAARCGAAVSSDVGGKVYGQQTDAMRTFGADPIRYLATNINYAFLLGTLLLVSIGFYTARITSLAVFCSTHPRFGPFFWESHFHQELRLPGVFFYQGTGWLVAKLLVCAAGTAVITYARGSRPKHSSTDVSLGITSTVLWTTLYVLLVHLGFALVEFQKYLH
jgi:ABC-type multidrug transport system ATPase subunit/ABC-type transporter Mla maintaining outer membrane lipid asymmetry permease subunit MlaE